VNNLVNIGEVPGVVELFKERIVDWIEKERPKGYMELRYQDVPQFDSLAVFKGLPAGDKVIWDLSFGRDLTDKRVFVLDPKTGLGKNLIDRFNAIFETANIVYRYDNKTTAINKFDA
jgi:hypothetical protein